MNEAAQQPKASSWHTLRRRAGCILGCLTEPLVLFALVLTSLVGGYIWRRKSGQKASGPEQKEGQDD